MKKQTIKVKEAHSASEQLPSASVTVNDKSKNSNSTCADTESSRVINYDISDVIK